MHISSTHAGDMTIDFLFPSRTDDEVRLPLQAMEYPECLYFLRKYLQISWHDGATDDLAILSKSQTVHGLKSTMLSFASQLQIPEELRRIQGKHRAVQSSTRLYARDDVSSALVLQRKIHTEALSGWRPLTPLARGGQCPLVEPKFELNRYRKEVVDEPWFFFCFQTPLQLAPMDETGEAPSGDSSSESSSDESSSSDSEAALDEQSASPHVVERGDGACGMLFYFQVTWMYQVLQQAVVLEPSPMVFCVQLVAISLLRISCRHPLS